MVCSWSGATTIDVNEHAGHDDVVRTQRAGGGKALDLGDHEAAIVAHAQRLIERAENAALVLVREVAALIRRGGANNRDMRE